MARRTAAARTHDVAPVVFEEAWSLEIEGRDPPAVDGSTLFLVPAASRRSAGVVAVEGLTGRRLWADVLPGRLFLAHDGSVLVRRFDYVPEVHVLDALTGQPRLTLWGAPEYHGRGVGLGVGRRVVLGGRHSVHKIEMARCYDLDSGARLWTRWGGWRPVGAQADVVVGATHVGGETVVQALDLADGRVRWERRLPPWLHQRAWCDGAVLVANVLSKPPAVMAFDAGTGRPLWRARQRYEIGLSSGVVSWAGRGLLLGVGKERFDSDTRRIEVFSATTGRRLPLEERELVQRGPLRPYHLLWVLRASEQHVLLSACIGASGELAAVVCAERKTGRCLWGRQLDGPVQGTLTLPHGGFAYWTATRIHAYRPCDPAGGEDWA